MSDTVTTGFAPKATGSTNFAELLTPIGRGNPCSNELTGSEIEVLEALQNALVACDLEKLQAVVQSFQDDPSSANRIMDRLAENLMDASIYSSWQTIAQAKNSGALFGLYYFEKSKGATFSLLLSTAESVLPAATEETIAFSQADAGAPRSMIRKQTAIAAADALAVLSQALIASI